MGIDRQKGIAKSSVWNSIDHSEVYESGNAKL